MNVTNSASEELLATVAVLPDQVLLERTRMLARHEQALQLSVLDHLREIEARRLYLRLGYSSLFDYTVRELHYTEAAAWRRIKAMRLCRETRGVRERLQDGSLNLSNAALLQNSFERWDRSGAGPAAAGSPGPGARRTGSAPTAVPGKAAGAPAPAPAPAPVLDAGARQQLVERAMGKSTRQVQQMLAEVDPEAAAPAERLRALGDGRWELKAVVDAECQQGLQRLRELLSHVDPHLTVGQLVGRLVREGVERYDPSRPPRRKRKKSDPASERSSRTPVHEAADGDAAAAQSPRQSGKALPPRGRDAATPPAAPSATKRSARRSTKQTSGSTSAPKPVAPPAGHGTSDGGEVATELTSAPKRDALPADHGRSAGGAEAIELTSAPKRDALPADRARSGAGAEATELTSAPKPRVAAGGSTPDRSRDGANSRFSSGESAPDRGAAKSRVASGRSIPAAVKREVWQRDQGCCTFVDRHTGRRCGSRFFLELDHVVPVAVGGGAEAGNLRLRCAAHHRYRHGRRQRSAPRDPVT